MTETLEPKLELGDTVEITDADRGTYRATIIGTDQASPGYYWLGWKPGEARIRWQHIPARW